MSSKIPLVSCLCVTRGKPEKLPRAIECFQHQTYANRELFIVYETDDERTVSFLEGHASDPRIHLHPVSVTPKRSLGELRNESIRACAGDYFCQWDDDDWYHVNRIEVQLQAVERNEQDASVLTNWLIFDSGSGKAYFSGVRLWEGSILCRRGAVVDKGLAYPSRRRMEDSFFLNALIAKTRLFPLVVPNLYIYEVHHGNTWSAAHFERMFSASQPLSAAATAVVRGVLDRKHTPEQASRLLERPEFLAELSYFHVNGVTMSDEQLLEYEKSLLAEA